jgi:hypothetical protein
MLPSAKDVGQHLFKWQRRLPEAVEGMDGARAFRPPTPVNRSKSNFVITAIIKSEKQTDIRD